MQGYFFLTVNNKIIYNFLKLQRNNKTLKYIKFRKGLLNPEPFAIIKPVQGSFNQGNVTLFGETAGRQRAGNALFLICLSIVFDICHWTSVDLHYILVQCDKLYKTKRFNGWGSVTPTEIYILYKYKYWKKIFMMV